MNSLREQLIAEAEAYQRDDMPLPLDLITSLMNQGIDHTLYQEPSEADAYTDDEGESSDLHNVD